MDSQKDVIVKSMNGNFVKMTHTKSGISVTKHNKSQQKAAKEAFEEIEMLVELWEGEVNQSHVLDFDEGGYKKVETTTPIMPKTNKINIGIIGSGRDLNLERQILDQARMSKMNAMISVPLMNYKHPKTYKGIDANPHIQFRTKQHVENNCLKCDKFCGNEHDFNECSLKLHGHRRICDMEFEYTPHHEKPLKFESEG